MSAMLASRGSESMEKLKPRAPILPPCRICGEKASGLHYGVNSCEACKGFFRRSMFNKDKYGCSKDQNCEIKRGKRNQCAYCRYHKCIRLGMSVEAIRTGRYTHSKKAADIIEVKTLEGTMKSTQKMKDYNELVDALHKGVKNTDMIDLLTTHHSQLNIMDRKIQSQMESATLYSQVFGLRPITHEDHQSLFKSTGIDVDNRKEAIEKWSYASTRRLALVIELALAIPGFRDLPRADQLGLIKSSRSEAITVMIHNRFDYENKLFYSSHTEHISPMSELVKIYDDEQMVERMFITGREFQKLGLTASEMLLTLSIIITFPDRVVLEKREEVQALQDKLVDALCLSIQMNHPNDKGLLGRLLGNLAPIRELTLRANIAMPKIKNDWSKSCNIDPIWNKFITDCNAWSSNQM